MTSPVMFSVIFRVGVVAVVVAAAMLVKYRLGSFVGAFVFTLKRRRN